jgi:hypothetical protein
MSKRWSRWMGLLLFLAALVVSCAGDEVREDALVGTWENEDGYVITFYDDSNGLIPGNDALPDVEFSYEWEPPDQLLLDLGGERYVVGIEFTADGFVWRDSMGDVKYRRVDP